MRKTYVILLIFTLLLAACVRPAPATTPAATTAAPGDSQAGPYPVVTLTPPPTNTPLPTSPPEEPTSASPEAGYRGADRASRDPRGRRNREQKCLPLLPQRPPPKPRPRPRLPPCRLLTPSAALGPPDFRDPMKQFSEINWEGETGTLPDTDNLKLALDGERLEVTGKKLFFDTWWFSWPVLEDFFLEMDVTTGNCSGRDAYGVILRGPLRGTGNTWGYIVSFSCDGSVLVRRVDDADPYTVVDLVPWTANTNIKAGSQKTNTLGVEANGDTLTIYANNFQIATIVDTRYGDGRYGVFVSAAQTASFTYEVDEIRYWDLDN